MFLRLFCVVYCCLFVDGKILPRSLNIEVDINLSGESKSWEDEGLNSEEILSSRENVHPLSERNVDTCTEEFAMMEHHTMCIKDSPKVISSGVSQDEAKLILEEHNRLRASVEPPASDMLMVVWDDKMAAIAQKWAKQCIVGHDAGKSRAIAKYGVFMGQSVAGGYAQWTGAIRGWFNEHERYRYGREPSPGSDVTHYLQLVQNTTTRIGCGFAECEGKRPGSSTKYFVCNYAKGFAARKAHPYTSGESCSACPQKCNHGLCDCGGKLCHNGGKLDVKTCICECRSIMSGPLCDQVKCPDEDKWFCGKTITENHCQRFPDAKYACPYICGLCKKDVDKDSLPKPIPEPVQPKSSHVSAHGCVFRGERPSKEKCTKYGRKGLDRDTCESEGGFIHTCTDCEFLSVRTKHCPVMCGTCDPPCKGKRCQNGGTLKTESCSCKCRKGYTGNLCQKPPCKGKRCLNDGELDVDTCDCKCRKGFSGKTCKNAPCGGNQCKNGGKMQYDTCKCQCPKEYEGKLCNKQRCAGKTCKNGGKMNVDTCSCKCVQRYQGKFCDKLPCRGKQCQNNGKLIKKSCSCKCLRNFTGKLCQKYVCPVSDKWTCRKTSKDSCKTTKVTNDCPFLCGRCK